MGARKKARRFIEEQVEEKPHAIEMWITYQGNTAPNRGPSWRVRRTSFSAMNREAGVIVLPCAHTKLTTSDRTFGAGAGESSTHYSTYTGVPIKSVASMPRIAVDDKAAILGIKEADEIRNALLSTDDDDDDDDDDASVPMFFQESKSEEFFMQLIEDLSLGAIADLTPGAGALAIASLKAGCQYCGFVKSAQHYTWLSNVIDRSALCVIVEQQSPLFHGDLASHIEKHFSDVIEDENARIQAVDAEKDESDTETAD